MSTYELNSCPPLLWLRGVIVMGVHNVRGAEYWEDQIRI